MSSEKKYTGDEFTYSLTERILGIVNKHLEDNDCFVEDGDPDKQRQINFLLGEINQEIIVTLDDANVKWPHQSDEEVDDDGE